MPRWKALPEELDPQVREFASQLRRLVDRSGLSIAAVSDRTGYSKTSWERYLNGRLLAPKGAIVALAEVTGTNPLHLTTMWELAERAWSRSEMRHDMTMEAIRISQARAALGELGMTPAKGTRRPAAAGAPGPRAGAGSAGAGAQGGGRGAVAAPPGPAGQPPGPPRPADGPPVQGKRPRRKLTMFLAGVVGAVVVIAAAFFLTDIGGGGDDQAAQAPTPSPTTNEADLPVGVECSGDDCTGEDPEAMGCSGEYAKTTNEVTVGTALVEVRYSKTCGAAWARIKQAAVGDEVAIAPAGAKGDEQSATVKDGDVYTPMVAVSKASAAKACATLKIGTEGCTS
ncbi:hypothetical protein DSC45_01545 [Streptomyces sp. YIM 130001]|uniref:helix-turn-helix domain-containing protein n=1 Tax=Streptomyces sp. YIM 130001 TaxID=2259644 RepID=UPI000E6526C3|nr:XRE family transcriptional regulator [Streptomyces sp. YIM 130001]RII21075.1 hypothetical protein DSC45_01545 [Streptomyces sp. YIM 130001]